MGINTGGTYNQSVKTETDKIDNATTDGLAGVNNSLAYRVHEIEKHFHNKERWFGISADQSGNDWALESTLNPFTAISGASDFGQDANDEAKLFGIADLPAIPGMVKCDIHRILIVEMSVDTPYIFRIIYGSDTMANNESAGQYSDFMVQNNPTGSKAGGFPVDIMMPRIVSGTDKVWVRVKCATNNATVTFFCGIHEYAG